MLTNRRAIIALIGLYLLLMFHGALIQASGTAPSTWDLVRQKMANRNDETKPSEPVESVKSIEPNKTVESIEPAELAETYKPEPAENQQVESQKSERIVHLPENRSIGIVWLIERPLPEETWWHTVPTWNMKRLGEIQGDVIVPEDHMFWLQVNANVRLKSRLSNFGPDDIQFLNLYKCSIVDDETLRQVSKLTGLEMLMLGDGTYTGKGLKYLTELKKLKALVLPGFVSIEDMAFLKKMPALEYLHFGWQMSSMITDEKMAEIGKITWLKQLSLSGSEIGSSLVHLKELKSLRFLDLGGNSNLDINRHLEHISGLTELEVLNLKNTQVGDAGLAHLGGLTKLKKLDISSNPMTFKVTDAGMVHLKNFKSLEEVDLPYTGITDAGIEQLGQLNSLKRIQIRGEGITNKSLEIIAKMKSIEDLDINRGEITDAGIAELAQYASLKALAADCITNEGLASLTNVKTLSTLSLSGNQIDGEGLAALKEFPELTELNLIGLKFGDKRISHLANLPKLERLWLANPDIDLRDEDLLALSSLTSLKALQIVVSQSNITNEGLKYLSELRNLTDYLYIPGNANINDDGLRYLSNLTALQMLNIFNCPITDAGLKHLEGLTSLRYLRFTGSRVTEMGAARLKEKIPGLDISF